MFIKHTSTKKNRCALIGASLYSILLLVFPLALKSQNKPSFDKPFKSCRIYKNNSDIPQIIASDNNKSFVFLNEENFLISIDLQTNLENWKSQSAGNLHPPAISDAENIHYLSSFENDTREKFFILNSISQKTGITNWQKKLGAYTDVKLFENTDKNLLYLSVDGQKFQAFNKNDGNLVWTINVKPKILSVDSSDTEHLYILTEETLLKIVIRSGEIISEAKIKNNPSSNSVKNSANILLGYPNGEFLKISALDKSYGVLWKLKAGGGISSLTPLEDKILVTSLDNFLYLYAVESGKLRWKRRVSGRINIKPVIVENFAIVLSSSDNIASIIELEGGKVVNQIKIEEGNYFSDKPFVLERFIVFPTLRGIYAFINTDFECGQ